MIFTLEHVVNSLAGVLKAGYPEYPIYDSPTQQGADFPCFFIFFMPSTIEGEIGDYFYRDLGIDIVFVQERNIPNANAQLHAIADFLDTALDPFPYSDGGGETAYIHTYERQWQSEDQELHYQFHIKQRVSVPRNMNFMQTLEEEHVNIKKE